jgi:dihydropyrimidinase
MLHPVIMKPSLIPDEEIQRMADEGNTSIKIFMVTQSFDNQYSEFLRVVKSAGKAGMMTMIHCEDTETISKATNRLISEGQGSLYYYAESRPVESEVLATERAVEMCKSTRAPIYVVHLSSKAALQTCEKAYAQSLPLYVETRPLYLHFSKDKFHESDGPLFVGQPPLRDSEDVLYLWQGLARGVIHTIGTDHAPWTREQKMDPTLDIINLRPGVNNLQVMLPMLYSEGVVKQKISCEQFVALTSTNAAKLFGLYPQKGTIAVGSDADLIIWDPNLTKMIEGNKLFSRAGFSVYDGMEVTGWPIITIRRGQIVYQNGEIIAQPGSGKIIKRSKAQLL